MSRLYGKQQRILQDQFDTRHIANEIEDKVIQTEIGEKDKAFIENQDMFWLATLDEKGRPTVSYKGGKPGFVKVIDKHNLAFPFYKGNGMFLSAGNIAEHQEAGLLFIDFEQPNRLRIQGQARLHKEDRLMKEAFPEAQMVVRIQVSEVWPNCPRFVHKMRKINPS